MDVNGREYLARMAELFDLPADVAAGLSHMELLGDPTAPFGGTPRACSPTARSSST